MTLDQNGGSLHGRAAVQKLGYFYTQKMAGFAPGYAEHLDGPCSYEIASALRDLCVFLFVDETAYSGTYGGYTYELTASGRRLAGKVSKDMAGERAQIKGILDICRERCGLRPAPLAYAAKCHRMLSDAGKSEYAEADIRAAGSGLPWDVSVGDAEEGTRLLQELRLGR